MNYLRKLPDADELKDQYSLSEKQKKDREVYLDAIKSIFDGTDKRKLLIIGPCSADNESAVLEYMLKLKKLSELVANSILIIPRIYTSKPRTNGMGYKGLIHRPNSSSFDDDIYDGIVATRKIHLEVINETGLFGADEMLYPEMHYYISDLLAYTAVGARSVENQQHRLVSSGLDMPVGMKNPTSGDTSVMLNAIYAACHRQHFIYHGYECESDGNRYAHAILRGYTDLNGVQHPNYHFEDITELYDRFQQNNFVNKNVIIDCSHSNSRKHYDEQVRIGKEVIQLCNEYRYIDEFVKGIMVESYLLDGNQKIGENIYGKSVTDACIGWEKTYKFVNDLFEILMAV